MTASTTGGWPRLVAVLSALTPAGEEIVSRRRRRHRALGATPRRCAIRLLSTSTPIPRGSRLRVTLAATSTAQSPANLLYLPGDAGAGSTITVRNVTLTLPALRTPVSR